ncbi:MULTISPECIES: hypothetical protein [unclassified Oceanispirochaeta]|uniref:hypothetical protein n=1 Tax=unclassified Oceanispirochaeta TaxID=2635722 RepID=UPI000E091556|nr:MULTISPECIES: hypothetical protein [unclassified Oceanispirochaeta]MBF9018644.1 hypothetical protein [Oceanispirochaeta sp. M2]NPD75081.1 hypothetical protein [Oceanispirochaeta sp. M1]RDG29068.1 hypothetical protein DV872_23575 [Oceanispirochaeta sp. M1]
MMNYLKILSCPDSVRIQEDEEWLSAENNNNEWIAGDSSLTISEKNNSSRLLLQTGNKGLKRVYLRWNGEHSPGSLVLGDQWERSYGDLEWAGIRPEKNLPWYFLVLSSGITHGIGVETGPSAMCFWRVDEEGVSLFLDVRNGTEPVLLGNRKLEAAVIKVMAGRDGISSYRAHRNFCEMLCCDPKLPDHAIYGGNNWYYTYGITSSREEILHDSTVISQLSESENRPYMVIDNGWQSCSYYGDYNGGPWDRGNNFFPEMHTLAENMKSEGVRPGIWFRPLQTVEKLPFSWRRFYEPQGGYQLDPSIPEVLQHIADDTGRLTDNWGFQMIKHDFSTRDIFGTYGNQFGNRLTHFNKRSLDMANTIGSLTGSVLDEPSVPFADRTLTTAEIVKNFYSAIGDAAGKALVIGCNTLTHLAAGIIPIQRTGEDTSSFSWEKTRRYGINALSHRMGQHSTFYHIDADCVGIDGQIPWELNREWLRLLADSGTPLFVSADPKSLTAEIRRDLKKAFSKAAQIQEPAEPLNWTASTTPVSWKIGNKIKKYNILRHDGKELFYG